MAFTRLVALLALGFVAQVAVAAPVAYSVNGAISRRTNDKGSAPKVSSPVFASAAAPSVSSSAVPSQKVLDDISKLLDSNVSDEDALSFFGDAIEGLVEGLNEGDGGNSTLGSAASDGDISDQEAGQFFDQFLQGFVEGLTEKDGKGKSTTSSVGSGSGSGSGNSITSDTSSDEDDCSDNTGKDGSSSSGIEQQQQAKSYKIRHYE